MNVKPEPRHFIAANEHQATLIETVKLMEYAAMQDFKILKGVKIGRRLINEYFKGFARDERNLKWSTSMNGMVPLTLTDDYSVSLVLA